jgi:ketosteroid isomerase-like protein
MTDVEAGVRALLDKQEIHDALLRYCRGIDRADADLVLSAFHDDAMDDHVGVDQAVAERVPRVVENSKTAVRWTSHNLCNVLIELDGDVANSESYLIAYHRIAHDGRDLDWVLGARYVDRFERRAGAWRIAHRTVVYDWERFDEVVDAPDGVPQASFTDDARHGIRTTEDYSYSRLSRLAGLAEKS